MAQGPAGRRLTGYPIHLGGGVVVDPSFGLNTPPVGTSLFGVLPLVTPMPETFMRLPRMFGFAGQAHRPAAVDQTFSTH